MTLRLWLYRKQRGLSLAWSFVRLAYRAARNKIVVVDSRIIYSKGGWKYFQMEISKTPLSDEHDYSDFKK